MQGDIDKFAMKICLGMTIIYDLLMLFIFHYNEFKVVRLEMSLKLQRRLNITYKTKLMQLEIFNVCFEVKRYYTLQTTNG